MTRTCADESVVTAVGGHAERAERDGEVAEICVAQSRAARLRIIGGEAAVRRQIARDLHDGAQQRLITLLVGLQMAREELGLDLDRAHRLLDDAVDQTQQAIDELRDLVAGVHPQVLACRGLAAAVEELARRAALPVTVEGSLPGRLHEVVEATAYFFVAEALTNIVKHARATRAVVTLGVDGLVLSVGLRDDGIGGAAVNHVGSGLAGLADRVGALGGRTTIESVPGRGTSIRATMPVVL